MPNCSEGLTTARRIGWQRVRPRVPRQRISNMKLSQSIDPPQPSGKPTSAKRPSAPVDCRRPRRPHQFTTGAPNRNGKNSIPHAQHLSPVMGHPTRFNDIQLRGGAAGVFAACAGATVFYYMRRAAVGERPRSPAPQLDVVEPGWVTHNEQAPTNIDFTSPSD